MAIRPIVRVININLVSVGDLLRARAAPDVLNLRVSFGSEFDSGNQILRVRSKEFIADGCCQIRNFRIYPAITREFLQYRR